MILWLLLACGPAPSVPALDPVGVAVREAEAGEVALADGDARTARTRFAAARAARPDDALLAAWEARAAAQLGALDEALALLDDALAAAPRFGEGVALRACLRARAGDRDGAAADVLRALELGPWTPFQARRDPDLAGLWDHPDLQHLPAAPLVARLEVPDRLAFLGTRVPVRLEIDGTASGVVGVEDDGSPQPAVLARVVETRGHTPDGDARTELVYDLAVTGPGGLRVGPLVVHERRWRALVPAREVPTEAPDDRAARRAPLDLRTPSSLLGGRVPPAAWRDGEGTWVAVPPGGRVRPAGDGVVRALVDGTGPVAELVWLPDHPDEVEVSRDGEAIWRAHPEAEPRAHP